MADSFNPGVILERTDRALMIFREFMIRDGVPQGDAAAWSGLAFDLISVAVEINNNLNRIAAAQERLATIAEADFAGAVEHEVQARVEPAVAAVIKEREKRSFIGQKHD